ncbi:Smr/MutS family protein, partial [candidate division KSB1 bacterium]
PGSSYALELTRRLGLPDEIIENTLARLGEKQLRIEDFIRELESRITFHREKGEEAAEKQRELDDLVTEYEAKLAAVQKEYHAKLDEAIGESEERVKEFNRNLEIIIKELRESQAAHEVIVRAKKEVEREKKRISESRRRHREALRELDKERPQADIPPGKIEVGANVRIKGYSETGIVIAENKKKKSVTVQMAAVKIEVSEESVVPASAPEKQTVHYSGTVPEIAVKPELDVRGLTADDAIDAVDQYLFDAAVKGFREVSIIHGKGMGILRRNIDEYLRNDDRVAAHRLGAYGEGDTGVTVVSLKT